MRTRLLDELSTMRIAAGPSRRKLSPAELRDKIDRQEGDYLDNGEDDDVDPDLDPGDQQQYSPSRRPMDTPEEVTVLDDPSELDEDEDEEDEDGDVRPSRRSKTKAESELLAAVRRLQVARPDLTYEQAFAPVLESPAGKAWYQRYYLRHTHSV